MLRLKVFIAKIIFIYPSIIWDKLFPFQFDYERYSDCFISKSKIENVKNLDAAPEVIYVFWTGDNEMSNNRLQSIKSLERNAGVEVKVINIHNLENYIIKDFPLHPAYQFLSLVHKSDYLRCYFMYHHGGGYSDIKKCSKSWKNAFIKLNNSSACAIGYREISGGTTCTGSSIDNVLSKYFFRIFGNGAFIFKSHSHIAKEWIDELHHRLNQHQEYLSKFPGNINGDNEGYPIQWSEILGQILGPILMKYNGDILISNDVKPILKNYR